MQCTSISVMNCIRQQCLPASLSFAFEFITFFVPSLLCVTIAIVLSSLYCVYIIKTSDIVSIVRWTNPNKNGMLVFNKVGFTFLLLFDMEYSRFDVEPNEIPMLSIWAYLDYYRTFLLAISNLLYLWKPTNRAFIWENRTKSNNFTKSIHWTIAFHQFPVNVLHNSFRHSIQSPSLFDLVLRNSYLFS